MRTLLALVLAFLVTIQGAFAQAGDPVDPQVRCSWEGGGLMAAKDSGGALTFLRSPVVYDDLSVLAAMQRHGPVPGNYGNTLLIGVDQGTVNSYHGPGFVLWYFHSDIGLPKELPWTDSKARCRARTPVVASEEFPGWVYAKVPHWARLNVPTHLLLKQSVCLRVKGLPQPLHLPALTQGSFAGRTDTVCSLPGRMQEVVNTGYHGVLFFLVVLKEGGLP